ncbi:MAG: T9SS type A sorting domain-containing protein [Bacteroidetes bacterium]|nr:T9SS type A sorting domain-containing protein [Bacteroidota bacterium]
MLGLKDGRALFGRITSNANNIRGSIMGAWTFTEYDSNGVMKNNFRIGGKVEMIDAQGDAAGNWYVLGRFEDSLILPSITYTRPNPTINPEPPYFLVKIANGSFVMSWAARLGNSDVSCRAFTLGPSNLLIAADSGNTTGIYDVSLTTGAYSVLFRQGGQSSTTSLQRDANGNIYIAGSCARKGYLNFGNGVVENFTPGVSHAYVASYLASLNPAWHYVMNDPTCAQRQINLYKNKYLYYTGTLYDSLRIGTAKLGKSSHTGDYMAALLDAASGNVIWALQSDTGSSGDVTLGNWAYHASITPDTALLLFAQGNSFVKWGNGLSTNLGNTFSSVVVSKGFDGNARWVRDVHADRVNDDRTSSFGNAVWISGYAYSTTAFTTMDTLNLYVQARRWTPFVAKLQLIQPPFVDTSNGVSGVPLEALIAAPNPARNVIHIAGLQGNTHITLCALNGREVLSQDSHRTEAHLEVSRLPRGLYLLVIRGQGTILETRRVVLE